MAPTEVPNEQDPLRALPPNDRDVPLAEPKPPCNLSQEKGASKQTRRT